MTESIKACVNCGKDFIAHHNAVKYCSPECRLTVKKSKKKVERFCGIQFVNCPNCLELFCASARKEYKCCKKPECQSAAKRLKNKEASKKYHSKNKEVRNYYTRFKYAEKRKQGKTSSYSFRISFEQNEKAKRLGGSAWLRKIIDEAPDPL